MGPTFNGVTQQLVVAATMLQVPLSVCSSLSCDLVGPLTAIRISLFFLADHTPFVRLSYAIC